LASPCSWRPGSSWPAAARDRRDAPAPAPTSAPPTRTLPPTLRSGTTLASSLPRLLRVADGYHQFEVSAAQYHLIGQRVG